MTRKIRVLFAIPELDHGGPDRVIFELLTHLNREHFIPSLMVSSPRGHYRDRIQMMCHDRFDSTRIVAQYEDILSDVARS